MRLADTLIAPSGTPSTVTEGPWQARLSLGFARQSGTSRLIERIHSGPLRVQKPLYPEGPEVCHAIIVHPPGGVVGGDRLEVKVIVGETAHALVTSPGAAKWYRANGNRSSQQVRIDVAAQARCEWLPQETIFFDASDVQLEHTVNVGIGAAYIGCEILCFGRTASGESFASGRVTQRSRILSAGKLVWFEQGSLLGDGVGMSSRLGMTGATVCATLIAIGGSLSSAQLNLIRLEAGAISGDAMCFGVTQTKTVTVARYLGNSSELAKKLMICAWKHLRPLVMERAAHVPRIWHT